GTALALPVGAPQFGAGGFKAGAIQLIFPVGFGRLFQLPTLANAGEAKIVRDSHAVSLHGPSLQQAGHGCPGAPADSARLHQQICAPPDLRDSKVGLWRLLHAIALAESLDFTSGVQNILLA